MLPSLFLVLALAEGAAPADPDLIFHEPFKDKLQAGWTILREDPKDWKLTERGLEVFVRPGNQWGPKNDARNVFAREVPDPAEQPLEVTATGIFNEPTHQYEQVDLVWYYDDGHQVKLGQELVDGKLSIVMGREERDRTRTIAIIPIASTTCDVRFLVTRDGKIRGQYRVPDGEWKDAGETTLPIKAGATPKVTLQFYQGDPKKEHWARVRSLTIRKLR